MINSEKKQIRRFLKQAERDNLSWSEVIREFEDGTFEYLFFRRTPFCTDGYKNEMDEVLNKLGWGVGTMQLTYKENLTAKELLAAISFKRAWQATYDFLVLDPLANVPFALQDFVSVVNIKEKTEIDNLKKEVGIFLEVRSFLEKNFQLEEQGSAISIHAH